MKRSQRFVHDVEELSVQFPTLEQSVLNFVAALEAGHDLPLTPISDDSRTCSSRASTWSTRRESSPC